MSFKVSYTDLRKYPRDVGSGDAITCLCVGPNRGLTVGVSLTPPEFDA
jgi:hypothetical protein